MTQQQNRYICQNCGKEFEQTDFSDDIWSKFCSMRCIFTWCRANMPKARPAPAVAKEKVNSQ